jgi:hypothetical protein
MDIHGLRTLNLVGTILFGVFGIVYPVLYLFGFGLIFWMSRDGGFFTVCTAILIVWIAVIAFLSYSLYNNTVVGLDRGNFEGAKRWTLIGAIMGFIFAGGIITLIIFLISYVSFDDAVWPKPYYYPPPGYYPYAPSYPYGPTYPPQQPTGINPCPNCGQPLRYVTKYQKWYCNNCKIYIKS